MLVLRAVEAKLIHFLQRLTEPRDIAMAEEDGYSVIRKVRESAQTANLPAIALTAYARIEDRMRALQAGFQMFLPKPVEAEELRFTVAGVVAEQLDDTGRE